MTTDATTPEYPPLDKTITALAQIPEDQWPVMVGHLCEAWDLRYSHVLERLAALERKHQALAEWAVRAELELTRADVAKADAGG